MQKKVFRTGLPDGLPRAEVGRGEEAQEQGVQVVHQYLAPEHSRLFMGTKHGPCVHCVLSRDSTVLYLNWSWPLQNMAGVRGQCALLSTQKGHFLTVGWPPLESCS
jgi:hypothetical protein